MGTEILNDINSPAVTMLDTHKIVDLGKMFMVSKTFATVANDESVYIRHKTGPVNHLHSILNIETVGQWEFTSFVETTYTLNGTTITPINRRSDSNVVFESIFYHTPTINVLGPSRLEFTFGYGENPVQVSTSHFPETLESIFGPNVDALIRLTNRSGATRYISFIFNAYELKLD